MHRSILRRTRLNCRTARIALFWALATVSPLLLLQGLVAGLIGPGPALWATSAVVGLGFLWLWLTMLHETETAHV